jgi:hypothetical protein
MDIPIAKPQKSNNIEIKIVLAFTFSLPLPSLFATEISKSFHPLAKIKNPHPNRVQIFPSSSPKPTYSRSRHRNFTGRSPD